MKTQYVVDFEIRQYLTSFEADIFMEMIKSFNLKSLNSVYNFDINTFKTHIGRNDNSVPDKTLNAINSIWKKESQIVSQDISQYGIKLISGFEKIPNKSIIEIEISQKAKKVLQNMQEFYNSIPGAIDSLFALQSIHSKRLYEFILKRHLEGDKFVYIEWNALKREMSLDNQYLKFNDFENRVLKTAKKEINAIDSFDDKVTNLTIDYVKNNNNKNGSSVRFIEFNFKFDNTFNGDSLKYVKMMDEVLFWGKLNFSESDKNHIYKSARTIEKSTGKSVFAIINNSIKLFNQTDKKIEAEEFVLSLK